MNRAVVARVVVAATIAGCAATAGRRVDHHNDYLLEPIPRGGVEFGLGVRHFDPEALRDAIAHDSRPGIRAIALLRLREEIDTRALPDLRAALADPAPVVVARAAHDLAELHDLEPIRKHAAQLRLLLADPAAHDDAAAALAAIGQAPASSEN